MESVPYQRVVPPGWQGYCCYCRRRLSVADWRDGRVMAAGDGDPWHCMCVHHLGRNRPEYRDALEALARAVLGSL